MDASAIPAAGAAQSPQLFERVLVHELTHAMIASLAPRGIPAWLHEGLAQYFEGDDPAARCDVSRPWVRSFLCDISRAASAD